MTTSLSILKHHKEPITKHMYIRSMLSEQTPNMLIPTYKYKALIIQPQAVSFHPHIRISKNARIAQAQSIPSNPRTRNAMSCTDAAGHNAVCLPFPQTYPRTITNPNPKTLSQANPSPSLMIRNSYSVSRFPVQQHV